MSWWTTVLGGAFGFILGGPLGAMLGVAFAGNLSKGKSNFGGFGQARHLGDQQRVQAAISVATNTLTLPALKSANARVRAPWDLLP